MTTYASLCTGIGGLDLAVEEVFSAHQLWHAEVDKDACAVLARHWRTPNLGDITVVDWSTVEVPDLLCAGPPCQPVSVAGKRQGEEDERWLWPDVLRGVERLRPRWLVLENPPGIAPWLPAILRRLAALGYVGRFGRLRASDVGACHKRERVFVLAHAVSEPGRLQPVGQSRSVGEATTTDVGAGSSPHPDGTRRPRGRVEPGSCGQTDGEGRASQPRRHGGADFPWGRYRPAIERHERALGRPAPWPVVEGTRSLSGDFTAWMMMLPGRWLSGAPHGDISNTAKKRLCGNAVVPLQAAAALRKLTA